MEASSVKLESSNNPGLSMRHSYQKTRGQETEGGGRGTGARGRNKRETLYGGQHELG